MERACTICNYFDFGRTLAVFENVTYAIKRNVLFKLIKYVEQGAECQKFVSYYCLTEHFYSCSECIFVIFFTSDFAISIKIV